MVTTRIPLPYGGRTDAYLDLYCVSGNEEMGFAKPRPTILVIPGGGYRFVSLREGEPIAMRFVTHGYNAAVLTYSITEECRFPLQLCQAALAMALLRENAEEWYIDPHRIAACGFSAGGHLALSLGVHWDKDWLSAETGKEKALVRPDALILSYPVITNDPAYFHAGSFKHLLGDEPTEEQLRLTSLEKQVGKQVPPVFLWHTVTDNIVPWKGAIMLTEELWKNEIPCEVHFFGWGPHGVALADPTTTKTDTEKFPLRHLQCNAHLAHWVPLCLEWLEKTL